MPSEHAFHTFAQFLNDELATEFPELTVYTDPSELQEAPCLFIERGPGTRAGWLAAPLVQMRLKTKRLANEPLGTTAARYMQKITEIILEGQGGIYEKYDYSSGSPIKTGMYEYWAFEDWTANISPDPAESQNVFTALLKTSNKIVL